MATPNYYATRAKAAYAAAEAATDPRDKAAYLAAAKTWERLAHPVAGGYSLDPLRQDIATLKKELAAAIDAPASVPAVRETVEATAHGIHSVKDRRYQAIPYAKIEF